MPEKRSNFDRRFERDRRGFLRLAGRGLAATGLAATGFAAATWPGVRSSDRVGADETPSSDARATSDDKGSSGELEAGGVRVTLPRDRVPLSFIIDDSTCLVNMGHFCTPQFAQAWPDREEYKKRWRRWPREIPDDFVRHFGSWCGEHGVRGKYSIVPYPACVGWLDRELPGWTRRQLRESIDLVQNLMMPNWDIHPEMITHTRVIDLKTGRPREPVGPATMENSFPQVDLSVDELAAYLAYSLKILKECGLPCEGVTTPGGFGNAVKEKLATAVDEAVRDQFSVEIPHYFKYIRGGDASTEPVAEAVRGEGTDSPQATMNVLAGTGDWFGGWQGDGESEPDRYLDVTGETGRMAELISRRQPAVMLCHWPGMYCNGSLTGFFAFQRIVRTLAEVHGDETLWMKVSEIARYWAVKRFAKVTRDAGGIAIDTPFATDRFTIEIADAGAGSDKGSVTVVRDGKTTPLREVGGRASLDSGSWCRDGGRRLVCFDLAKGTTRVGLGV